MYHEDDNNNRFFIVVNSHTHIYVYIYIYIYNDEAKFRKQIVSFHKISISEPTLCSVVCILIFLFVNGLQLWHFY